VGIIVATGGGAGWLRTLRGRAKNVKVKTGQAVQSSRRRACQSSASVCCVPSPWQPGDVSHCRPRARRAPAPRHVTYNTHTLSPSTSRDLLQSKLRSQSRTELKPTVHKLLPAAQSDPETELYKRPTQPLQTHRATLVASRVRRCKDGGNI